MFGGTFPTPRPFQLTARDALAKGVREGHKNQCVNAPTGSGKTILAMMLANMGIQKGKRVIFMCDRQALIYQTSKTAYNVGLADHGVIMGDRWELYRPEAPLQICSAQTIASRGWPQADLIIVDECHTQHSVWTEHVNETDAVVVGLSATPFSLGLGKLFTNLINATTMRELTESKVLVPMRVLTCVRPDMTGAKTVGGVWSNKAAGERGMDIIGDVVLEWLKHAENRKTICFGSSIAHCKALAEQFNAAGVMAMLYTSKTKDDERKAILQEFEKPDSMIRVLISVEALGKGFDVPDVSCVIDCRPLRKSLSTAIQMWGRGLRSSPDTGKVDCILLDHSGNIVRFAEDFEQIFNNGLDSLHTGEKFDRTVRADAEDSEKPEVKCPACGYQPFRSMCMSCGFEKPKPVPVQHDHGEAVEFTPTGDRVTKQKWYSELWGYAQSKGYSEGWVAHKYRAKFGVWPRGLSQVGTIPSPEIARWVMHQNIRYAKGMAKRGAR